MEKQNSDDLVASVYGEYYSVVKKVYLKKARGPQPLPIVIEKDEEGMFTVECPVLPGCYTQGRTHEEALKNIQEVIDLILEEEESRKLLKEYSPMTISFQTITI